MRQCEICKEPLKGGQKRFCSLACRNKFFAKEYGFKKGNPGVWKGRKMPFSAETIAMLTERINGYINDETPEQRKERLRKSKESRDRSREMWFPKIPRGENHHIWHGDKTDYHMLHRWIRNHWTKTGKCEICGKETKTQWSNKDHKYRRSHKEEWQELCVSCHRKWDKSHGL